MALSGGIDITQDRILTSGEKLTNPKVNEATTFTARVKAHSITSRELAGELGVVTFDTIALFRANTEAYTNGQYAKATGYYTAGANDAGDAFTADTSDTTTADDGFSCIVDGNGLRWKRTFPEYIDARWAGVKADGATDDSTAVAAIAAYLNNEDRTVTGDWVRVVWPMGIIVTDPVTFYNKARVFMTGQGTWSRNFPSGTVFAPAVAGQSHILRFGHPTSPDSSSLRQQGLHLENLSFTSVIFNDSDDLEDRTHTQLTDCMLLINGVSSVVLANLHFGEGPCTSLRTRYVFEAAINNLFFDTVGAWDRPNWKIDDSPTNTSAWNVYGLQFEACRGPLIESTASSNLTDLNFNGIHWESGAIEGTDGSELTKTLITSWPSDYDTSVPLFKFRSLKNSIIKNLFTTNHSRYYYTDSGTDYAYDEVFNLTDCRGFYVDGIILNQIGKSTLVATDTTNCYGQVRNIEVGFPQSTDEEVQYDIQCKGVIHVDDPQYHGNTLNEIYQKIKDPFDRVIYATELANSKDSTTNDFTQDTGSINKTQQVFKRGATSPGFCKLDPSMFEVITDALEVGIRVKKGSATAITVNLVLEYTTAGDTTHAWDLTTASESDWQWFWVYAATDELNPTGDTLDGIIITTTAGSPMIDAVIMRDRRQPCNEIGAAYIEHVALASETFDANTDVDTGTDEITITGHGFEDEDQVVYADNSTGITGLTDGNTYYVIYVDANTIQLESSIGGGAVDITATGTGTAYLGEYHRFDTKHNLATTNGGGIITCASNNGQYWLGNLYSTGTLNSFNTGTNSAASATNPNTVAKMNYFISGTGTAFLGIVNHRGSAQDVTIQMVPNYDTV